MKNSRFTLQNLNHQWCKVARIELRGGGCPNVHILVLPQDMTTHSVTLYRHTQGQPVIALSVKATVAYFVPQV